MFKLIPLGACLVFVAALMGAGAVSARAGTTSVPVLASQSAQFTALSASTMNLGGVNRSIENQAINEGGDGAHRLVGRHDAGNAEETEPEDEGNPPPTPEPGTLLSFAAALGIGGGVFLLGRLRRERR